VPSTTPVTEFVRLSGLRWPSETLFEDSKGPAGFDHYETRSWLAGQQHRFLTALAHCFLVRVPLLVHEQAPALTIYQRRGLLVSLLPKPLLDAAPALTLVRDPHKRNFVAWLSHRNTMLARRAALPLLAL
jgi:hypothetical protein